MGQSSLGLMFWLVGLRQGIGVWPLNLGLDLSLRPSLVADLLGLMDGSLCLQGLGLSLGLGLLLGQGLGLGLLLRLGLLLGLLLWLQMGPGLELVSPLGPFSE